MWTRLNAASWKAKILTVCVFDASAFDDIFAERAPQNRDGVLEVPTHHRTAPAPLAGWDFNERTVHDYLQEPREAPPLTA